MTERKKNYEKKSISLIIVLMLMLSIFIPASAIESTVGTGTWSRGKITIDPIPAFSGYITDSDGNIKKLDESPFTKDNIITKDDIKKIIKK